MFERFTDRARRVVVLAQEEASMLHHNHIGTEHILLGLIREGEGVAAKSLESLGISLEAVRQHVGEITGQGQQVPSGHIPFTPRAKDVLELSLRVVPVSPCLLRCFEDLMSHTSLTERAGSGSVTRPSRPEPQRTWPPTARKAFVGLRAYHSATKHWYGRPAPMGRRWDLSPGGRAAAARLWLVQQRRPDGRRVAACGDARSRPSRCGH